MKMENTPSLQETPSVLDAALIYLKLGFSPIPLRIFLDPKEPGKVKKVPALPSWTEYQKRHPTEEEIRGWFHGKDGLGVGIVTGRLSGIMVADYDGTEGRKLLQEKDNPLTAWQKTGSGGDHLLFGFPDEQEVRNTTRLLPGLDIRAEGGFIAAAPSAYPGGKRYEWLHPPDKVPLADPPAWLLELAKPSGSDLPGGHPGSVLAFTEGRRDEDLFHVANCLVKGRMPEGETLQVLEILAQHCAPPLPLDEARAKVKSALERAKRKEINLTQEVREWVLSTDGDFSRTDCPVPGERKAINKILQRLREDGTIEKVGTKDGIYRLIDTQCERIDFLSAIPEPLSIRWPFRIETLVHIFPGNTAVVAGCPDAGKTAYLLNVVRLNMDKHKIHYYSSEMGDVELNIRLSKFEGISLDQWTFDPWERICNFEDVIRPDDVNIIDFLEVPEEFWKVGTVISKIHNKLRKGIAIIALQKPRGRDEGLGGMFSLQKPRLYLSMEEGTIKIVKAKNWAGMVNPNGLGLDFKIVNGCRFIEENEWIRR